MEKHPILDLPMEDNDAEADTIRDYFKELLFTLLQEEEGFSGKRPFGNSGWCHELYHPLVKAGLVEGTIDEDGDCVDYDYDKAAELILAAIDDL